jgi:hypothetical protein
MSLLEDVSGRLISKVRGLRHETSVPEKVRGRSVLQGL